MNEITARILKYYKVLEDRRYNTKQQEPITINNYVFPNTQGIQGIKEYQGMVIFRQRHTKVKHRYKLKYVA
jgi:hypothetical protein